MAMDILGSLNTSGSGLNIAKLASDLAMAETAPRKALVSDRIDRAELSLSALDRFRGQLDAFGSALSDARGLSGVAVRSDQSALGVSVRDPALVATQDTRIEVQALAQSQVLQFGGFQSGSDTIGTGTLTVDFGGWDGSDFYPDAARAAVPITVGPGATLDELAESLSSIAGVTARVLDVGDGTKSLGILSDTGAMQGLRISVAGDATLSQFDFSADPAAVQVRQATDAVLSVDGILLVRPTNTVDDVLDGVTLSLNAVTSGAATVSAEPDVEAATAAIRNVVDQFNALHRLAADLTARGVGGQEAGPLAGESAVTSAMAQLRQVMGTGLDGFGAGPLFLSDLGVRTERDGTLMLDTDRLEEVMAKDPAMVEAMLRDRVASPAPGVKIEGLPWAAAPAGQYDFTRDAATGEALLNGVALTGAQMEDGQWAYAVPSGPMAGVMIMVDDATESARIDYGRSLMSGVLDALDAVTSGQGGLARREDRLGDDLTANAERLAELDSRAQTAEARYKARFTEMELTVTRLNSTGDYLTSLLDAWNNSDG